MNMGKTSLLRTALLLMVLSPATVLSTNLFATDTVPLVRACDKCNFLLAWGSAGSGPGQFSMPHGAAVDRDGNVYVADSGNNRVEKFDSSGRFITQWGSQGSGPGQFNSPYAIAADSSGPHVIVYVTDTSNSRVESFDGSGGFITQWGWPRDPQTIGNTEPMGIAVDRAGYVYVATRGQDRIEKFDNSGGLVTGWGPSWSGYGELYPLNVAVDSSGNLYVPDGNTKGIVKFDSHGNYITQWGSRGSGNGQFVNPNYIAIDSFGNVYVTDSVNNCVQKFSSTGGFLTKWGSKGSGDGQFSAPLGVAVDSSGNVYVVSQDSMRVEKFGDLTTTQLSVSSTTQNQHQASIVLQTLTTDNIAGLGSITFDETAYMKLSVNLTINWGTHKILATPPPAYEFDHWQGTSSTSGKVVVSDSLARSTTVIIEGCEMNCFLTAWFRPSSVSPMTATAGQPTVSDLVPGPDLTLIAVTVVAIGAIIGLAVYALSMRRRTRRPPLSVTEVTPAGLFEVPVNVSSVGKTVTLEVGRDHTMASLVETLVSTLKLPKDKAYAVEYGGKLISQSEFGKTLATFGIREGSKLSLRVVE